jgi:glutaredoxin
MRFIIRTFFKALRIVLGPFMLLWERLRQPKGVLRSPAAQQVVERQCQSLLLYQFSTCPFCIKVRQEMRALSLPIERRDAQHNPSHREELVQGGGAYKVPCLKVTESNGQARWIYESGAIIGYLRARFPKARSQFGDTWIAGNFNSNSAPPCG